MEFSVSSGTINTLILPVEFTMFELSNINDCKVLRNYFIKKGLQDITPSLSPHPMEDPRQCYNTNKYAGFFNDDYHHGRWLHASQDNPFNGENE